MIEDFHLREHGRRIKVIEFSAQILRNLFTPRLFIECVEGLPEDAKVVGLSYDHNRRVILMLVESNEFEITPDGAEPLRTTPIFKSYYGKELTVLRRIIESAKVTKEKILERI